MAALVPRHSPAITFIVLLPSERNHIQYENIRSFHESIRMIYLKEICKLDPPLL